MMMMMTMVAVLGGPRHDTAAGAPHRQPRRIADVYGMDFGSWRCGRMEEKWNSGEWGGLPFDLRVSYGECQFQCMNRMETTIELVSET